MPLVFEAVFFMAVLTQIESVGGSVAGGMGGGGG